MRTRCEFGWDTGTVNNPIVYRILLLQQESPEIEFSIRGTFYYELNNNLTKIPDSVSN
jgi:hypothetical protein